MVPPPRNGVNNNVRAEAVRPRGGNETQSGPFGADCVSLVGAGHRHGLCPNVVVYACYRSDHRVSA